jgi:hypothetical protein
LWHITQERERGGGASNVTWGRGGLKIVTYYLSVARFLSRCYSPSKSDSPRPPRILKDKKLLKEKETGKKGEKEKGEKKLRQERKGRKERKRKREKSSLLMILVLIDAQ